MNIAKFLILVLLINPVTYAQQQADTGFQFSNPNPVYASVTGPRVCIDEGHHNFHTLDGRYLPFAQMVREDGYVVQAHQGLFTEQSLSVCEILVIANALHASNSNNWSYPHPSAFAAQEIQALILWVNAGGKLLLIADHAPFAGAAADLGAVSGLMMADIYAVHRRQGADVFMRNDNTLHDHAITRGRNGQESIQNVTSFTGQAAMMTGDWQALLSFSAEAFAYMNPQQAYQQQTNQVQGFSISGWFQAAAREWGNGRMVFLGEAAMCSAQTSGNGNPMGMNSPQAPQNAQFCLNLVRWLSEDL